MSRSLRCSIPTLNGFSIRPRSISDSTEKRRTLPPAIPATGLSASYDLLPKPRQEIIDLLFGEVRQALPAARNAELVKATVIKEAAATFSPSLESIAGAPSNKPPCRAYSWQGLDGHRLARHHGRRRAQRVSSAEALASRQRSAPKISATRSRPRRFHCHVVGMNTPRQIANASSRPEPARTSRPVVRCLSTPPPRRPAPCTPSGGLP